MTSTKPFLRPVSDGPAEKRNLKILHVAECYEAGVGHAVDTIVRILDRDTHILLYSGDRTPSPRFSQSQKFRSSLPARILDVRAAVRHHKPDIVHLHSSWAGVYGRTTRLSKPIVYQPHCFKFDDPDLPTTTKYLYRVAERRLGKLTDVVLSLSPHESQLVQRISPASACVMLPNAPTLTALSGCRESSAILAKKVVMVGRVSRQKDPAFFAEVATLIRNVIPEAEFVWAGEGDQALTADLRNAGVSVTGWLESSALAALLDSASCYVHSANYEGFPLSLLDAAARKLPIVAREIPAFAGTGLTQGTDATAVGQHVIAILNDVGAAHAAALRGQRVLDQMNEHEQRKALKRAYQIALGETK